MYSEIVLKGDKFDGSIGLLPYGGHSIQLTDVDENQNIQHYFYDIEGRFMFKRKGGKSTDPMDRMIEMTK